MADRGSGGPLRLTGLRLELKLCIQKYVIENTKIVKNITIGSIATDKNSS